MSQSLDYSRRVLLRTLGLSAAGLALGGGAAWAQGHLAEQATLQASVQDLRTQLSQAQQARSALNASATTLQGQVTTLTAQFDAATGQAAQLAAALAEAQRQTQTLQAQLSDAQTRNLQAEAKLGQYQSLIKLYDQLEAVGLDALAQSGLQSAAAGLTSVLGVVPALSQGLEAARGWLADFEAALPDFNAGLTWLGQQTLQLKLSLYALEKAAQQMLLSTSTGVVAVFGGFIKVVLEHLPFDAGQKAQAAFNAAQTVITQTATMTAQTDERILAKLTRYVSDGPRSWPKQLIAPLRTQTLAPAADLLTAVARAQTAFDEALQQPVQTALSRRADVRAAIAAFRSDHQI